MDNVEAVVSPACYESVFTQSVHDWSKKFECKTLCTRDIREFWGKNVPMIYSPSLHCDCLNILYEEERAQEVLFKPMEWFICGTNETEKLFEHLKNNDPLPTLCGKVFKSGEPTYSCRDCGLDPTCVLCVGCFRNSKHKNHRYKMSASGGGGYCDCGDEEAWKTHPFCDNHHKGKSQDSGSLCSIEKLPPDLVERLRFLMNAALLYSHQMLTWEHAINLPADLQLLGNAQKKADLNDTYATVLFNDETHTYEQLHYTGVKVGQEEVRGKSMLLNCGRGGDCQEFCGLQNRQIHPGMDPPCLFSESHNGEAAPQIFWTWDVALQNSGKLIVVGKTEGSPL